MQTNLFQKKSLLKKEHEKIQIQQNKKLNQLKQNLTLKVNDLKKITTSIDDLQLTIKNHQNTLKKLALQREQDTKSLEKIKNQKEKDSKFLADNEIQKKQLLKVLETLEKQLKNLNEQFPQNKTVENTAQSEIKLLKLHNLSEKIAEVRKNIRQKSENISKSMKEVEQKSKQSSRKLSKIRSLVMKQKKSEEQIKTINDQIKASKQKLKLLERNIKQTQTTLQKYEQQVFQKRQQREEQLSYLPPPSNDQMVYISQQGLKWITQNYDPKCPQKYYFWTSDYKVQMPIFLKKTGFPSRKPSTLIQMFKQTLQKYGNNPAMTFQVADNVWKSISYNNYYNECCKFAKACIYYGLTFYTAIMIIGFNSPQWAISFYGAMFGHYLPVGMYTTNGEETCEYIANHCEGELVVVQDKIQLAKYYKIIDRCPKIKLFVIYKQQVPTDLPLNMKGRVVTWLQFLDKGDKFIPNKIEDTVQYRMNKQLPGNCACFIYTSGTTGMPKAVMMSHDNLGTQIDGVHQRIMKDTQFGNGNGRVLSYLPLSHLAALLVDLVGAMRYAANTYFPHPSVLQNNMLKFLLASQPSVFLGVPRVWQKLEQKLSEAITNTTGIKKKLLDWAMSIGIEGTFAQIHNKPTPFGWSIAKRLFNKIKNSLGLGQCELMIFGAAPMKQSTRKFFLQLNFPLLQGYGMSETSGGTNISDKMLWTEYSQDYLKEAGTPIADQEIMIEGQNQQGIGEICIRGRLRFMGYYKNDQANKSTIDRKGFVHSGDQGRVDSKKNIYITGRIKELIITAGGQNIPPLLIQNQIITQLPIISQVVVVGDKRKYLACLICLKMKNIEQLADQVIEYVGKRGSQAKTIKQAISCPKFNEIIKKGIEEANKKAISNAQKVQKYVILPSQFTIDSGLLTPTMKLKRNVIQQKFNVEIDTMYLDSKL